MSFNVFELFAGCGGLGYGFHQEGFNIVACNELEKSIAETYKENFENTKVIVGDITKTNIKQDIYNVFKDTKCDVILGGPPCVAYSMSGLRNPRDPRGQLFKDYVEIVKQLNPKLFIMENVKGILTMKHDKPDMTNEEKIIADNYYNLEKQKIDLLAKKKIANNKQIENELKIIKSELKKMEKHLSIFRMKVTDIIKNTFIELGYNIEMKLLNSANFGVPQKRERVIFIGLRNDIKKNITYPVETHNKKGDDGKKKWISVKETIDDLKHNENNDLQHIYTKHTDDFLNKIKNTKIGNSVNPKYKEAFFRCFPDEPSNTVKENHGGVFIHYEKDRVMTPRELARLQSFPDSFKFKGTKSNILVQIGNAVPCGLSQSIAKEVKRILT